MDRAVSLSPAEIEQLGQIVATYLAQQPRLVDAPSLASLLSVSVETVKRYTNRGLIPCVRIGRRVLYQPEAAVQALMASSSKAEEDADE